MEYNIAAIGGTFDKLHAGHKAFLAFAFSMAKKVIIGLTSDDYVKQYKKNKDIEPFLTRKKILEDYLLRTNLLKNAEIIPIDDPFGPAIRDTFPIDALIVTQDTKDGAEKINEYRKQKNLSLLPLEVMPLVAVGDVVLSSENIRKGLIDVEGKYSNDSLWFKKNYKLPQEIRSILHKPFGELLKDGFAEIKKIDQDKIILVGDVTTNRFLENGIFPKIAVIDFVVERKEKYGSIEEIGFRGNETVIHISNPPATLTAQSWKGIKTIEESLREKNHFILQVSGEEDLLVLPLVALLPVGFFVFYGQPHEGLVKVEITLETKKRVNDLLSLFIPEDY